MRDAAYRKSQRDGIRQAHVAPVNAFVDQLATQGRGWVPHVAPSHGGVGARLLWVMRDPGPRTADPDHDGTGFLCAENADPTAERLCGLLDHAGIDLADTMPWNAYPWYVNRPPSVAELRAGLPPLRHLLSLLPQLEVVLLFGNHARHSWRLLERETPAATAGLAVFSTRHPGRQAFIGTAEQRATWRADQSAVVDDIGALLHSRQRAAGTRTDPPSQV